MGHTLLINRRQLMAGFAAFMAAAGPVRAVIAQTGDDGAVTATDVVGRTVTLDHPAERIVVTSRTGFYTLALLGKEAGFERVVAWYADLRTTDKDALPYYGGHRAKHSLPRSPRPVSPMQRCARRKTTGSGVEQHRAIATS